MTHMPEAPTMKLQVIPLPVSDIDRSNAFYQKVGFQLDHDVQPLVGQRVVQLTPKGSDCSIVFLKGMGEIDAQQPGSIKGLHLIVRSVAEVRDLLLSRGIAVSKIIEYPQEIRMAHFSDPDGNSWVLQEFPPDVYLRAE
jgi:predicted enzyme related to lactoylglutathione lyase